MNKAILSVRHPQIADRLRHIGYEIIPTDMIPCEMPYERDHADLQCLLLDDTAFVLKGCERLSKALSDVYTVIECGGRFSGRYPDNVCLSALKLGKKLLCRVPSLDEKVKEYCTKNRYELIHTNQGYAKCSCAVIGDHAVITADQSIIRALAHTKIDVLPIGQGSINLDGAGYGFIGGASGYDKDRKSLYFCGDIKTHPDHQRIKDFCDKHGTSIVNLTDDILPDIGGILFC